jgi:hypothetical protein
MRQNIRKMRLACILASLCAAAGLSIRSEAQGGALRPARPLEAIPAILEAFRTHRIVSYPGGHTDGNEGQTQLRELIRDRRFAATVNDIVVEFGSSRYQDLMDRYIRGEDVSEPAVRVAWLDAVQAGTALDNANTAAFFRTVREVNSALPPERKLRVLLGDPPMDWENVRNKTDFRKWVIQRDSYPADLVRREVLAHKRRALIVWANGHLMRQEIRTNYDMSTWQAQTIVSLLEAAGTPVFTVRSDGDLTRWQADTASWKPMSLTIVRGTTVGAADFSDFDSVSDRYRVQGEEDFVPLPREQWVSRRLEDIVDAILYVGREHTSAPIAPDLCADSAYIKMRLDRIALIGLPQGEADRVKRSCTAK